MSESQQHKAIKVLSDVWRLAPDMRLGQLMAHLGFLAEVHCDKGLGEIDDDELVAILYRHRAELEGRLTSQTDRADVSVSGSSTSPVT